MRAGRGRERNPGAACDTRANVKATASSGTGAAAGESANGQASWWVPEWSGRPGDAGASDLRITANGGDHADEFARHDIKRFVQVGNEIGEGVGHFGALRGIGFGEPASGLANSSAVRS